VKSAFGGSQESESDGRFRVGAFGRNLASDVLYSICCVKKCYTCCTFSVICKDNVAINCITVRHKKVHSYQLLWAILR
jgi:hypothetical protein